MEQSLKKKEMNGFLWDQCTKSMLHALWGSWYYNKLFCQLVTYLYVFIYPSREESKTIVHPVTKRVINYLLWGMLYLICWMLQCSLPGHHTIILAAWLKKSKFFYACITLNIWDCYEPLSTMKSCSLIPHSVNKDKTHKNSEGNYNWWCDQLHNTIFRQSERVREVQDQIQKYGDGSTVIKVWVQTRRNHLLPHWYVIVSEVAFTSWWEHLCWSVSIFNHYSLQWE